MAAPSDRNRVVSAEGVAKHWKVASSWDIFPRKLPARSSGGSMTRYEDVSSARFLRLRNRIPAPSVAQWTVDIWRQIEGILTPVFGSNVVALLYEKSLQAAKATYPWLPSGLQPPDEPPAMLLVDLKRALTTRSPAEAIDGVALMLQSFSCLLESLIGKAL